VLNFAVDVTEQVRARRDVERLLAESERARAAAERAAAALAESEARFRAVEDASPDAVLLLRPLREGSEGGGVGGGEGDGGAVTDFEFVYGNPAADRMLAGGAADAFVGRRMLTLFPGSVPEGIFAAYVRALETGVPYTREQRYTRDGLDVGVRVTAVRAGGLLHLRHEDIAERLQAEAERARLLAESEAARAEAEAANRTKGEFLAVMSHELRTPLNAIGGYAELMEMGIRGPVTDQQREDLGRIQRSQRHLLGLVNEVLNYAKLETGNVRYDAADVAVCEAVAGAEALVAPQARAKELVFAKTDCPGDLVVRADPEKLRQVLVNLLGNAVKFTASRDGEPGRIAVSCTADGARVRIAVRDTGIGIAGDKLAAIFEPFVQVRADLTRTAEGTGLGLAISRDLARGMGGDLTAESTPGLGSTFTLTLPAA
jgi:signal transduction histidine kinase